MMTVRNVTPPRSADDVTIVIPAWNQTALTDTCLQSISRAGGAGEVIVVDNGSREDLTARITVNHPWARVIRNAENRGHGPACNQGAAAARGDVLVFLDNDTVVTPGWLDPLLATLARHQGRALLGPRLVFPDGRIEHAGYVLGYGLPYPITVVPVDHGAPDARARSDLAALSGSCLMIDRALFTALGGFDERYENGYEDVDLSLRARQAGAAIAHEPASVVVHHQAASGGRFAREAANLERFSARWLDEAEAVAGYAFDIRALAPRGPRTVARAPMSVIVVATDALTTLAPCFENVRATIADDDEIIIVDDASTGAGAALARSLLARDTARVRLIARPVRGGFAGAAADGIAAARHDHVALLNANVRMPAGGFEQLRTALDQAGDAVAVAPNDGGETSCVPDQNQSTPNTQALAPGTQAPATRAIDRAPLPCWLARRKALGARMPWALAPGDLVLAEGVRAGRIDACATRVDLSPPTDVAAERYRIARDRPPRGAFVSIVILVHDNLALTSACVESLYARTLIGSSNNKFELIVVDNGSRSDVAAWVDGLARAHGNVVFIRNDINQGFAYGSNQGLLAARGDPIVVLNNDVVLTHGWLDRLLALLDADSSLGMVGPCTNATSGAQLVATPAYRGLHELDDFAQRWDAGHFGEWAYTPRLVGLCYVMRRRMLEAVGGFDPMFGYGNYEDDDLCVRASRAGFRLAIAFDVFIHHHGSATFKALGLDPQSMVAENWEHFCAKWNHPRDARGVDALRRLAADRPFDARRDFVPLDHAAQFSPRGPALDLGCAKPERWLVIPDLRDDAWLAYIAPLTARFSSRDPIAIVVRVEPPTPARVNTALSALTKLFAQQRRTPEDAVDVVFEATALAPMERASLYRAVTAFVPCGNAREPFHRREATAVGVPIADAHALARR